MNNNNVPNRSNLFQNGRTRPFRRFAQGRGRGRGLEAAHFTGDQKLRWLYEDSARKLHAASPALSTASNASSSGFNSWASDNQREDVTLTPGTAEGDPTGGGTPAPEPKPEPKKAPPVIMYEGRNILDLGANLCDPKWNFRPSDLPKKDPQHFFQNRSQYSRVNDDAVPLHVDVPCELCDFVVSYYD